MKSFLQEKGLLYPSYTDDEHRVMNLLCYYHDWTNELTKEQKTDVKVSLFNYKMKGVEFSFGEFKMLRETLRINKVVSQLMFMDCIYSVPPSEFNVEKTKKSVENLFKDSPIVKILDTSLNEGIEVDGQIFY